MNPNTKPKKPSVFAGLAGKLLLVVIGLLALGGVAMLIINLVVPSDPTIERMQGLLQQQVEVVRVSETIQRSATDPELKNVALTAQLSVDSSRQATESYLTSRNIKINPKTLGLKRNAETDTTLEAAKSSGTFDSTAATVLKDELQAYSQQIASDYKVIKGDKATKLTYENYRSAKYLADWAAERS